MGHAPDIAAIGRGEVFLKMLAQESEGSDQILVSMSNMPTHTDVPG